MCSKMGSLAKREEILSMGTRPRSIVRVGTEKSQYNTANCFINMSVPIHIEMGKYTILIYGNTEEYNHLF